MRAKKLRDAGKADPIKICSVCQKKLKKGAGSNRAWLAGLCFDHWKQTKEGKAIRREKEIKQDVWGVYYFCGEGDDLKGFTSIRSAISAAVLPGDTNLPVFAVWSDGRVTTHPGITHRAARGLKPEDGDELLDDFEVMRQQVPESKRTWF